MEEIDISFPSKQFEKHLLDNDRILFSGKFGVGKTTFLKHFFKDEENIYWINPIDYTFTRDTDIFQQIKYDILLQLVSKNAFKGETDLSEFFHAFAYIYSDNLQPFILENLAGKKGKVIFDTFKHIKSIFNKYQNKDKRISWKYIKKN